MSLPPNDGQMRPDVDPVVMPGDRAPIYTRGSGFPPSAAPDTGECVELPSGRGQWSRFAGDSVYVTFVTAAWMFGNILGALGCAVAFFIVISAGEWDAFFLQLDNLTSHYAAADLGRRGVFEHQLVQVFTILIVVIALLRVPTFVRHLRQGLAEGRGR